MIAMNPLKEMIPSNKKRRDWYALDKEGERSVIGSMYESSLRVVFAERLYKTVMRLGFPGHSKASFTVRVFPRSPSSPALAGHAFTFFSVTSFIFSTTDCSYV